MKKLLTFLIFTLTLAVFGQVERKKNPSDFLPNGYIILEEIYGDLNKDEIDDCVLLIKGTDKSKVTSDKYRGQLDQNRRGIIVLIKKNSRYDEVVKNYDYFSSENEDGGVYFAPELSLEIKEGNLHAHYGHGRYGYWEYIFRLQNSDLELIGYNEGNPSSFISEYVTFDETSINFLSKEKLEKEVIRVETDGREIFKETWKKIIINRLVQLSEIKDFDVLDMTNY